MTQPADDKSGFGAERARRDVPLFTNKQEFIRFLATCIDPKSGLSVGPQGLTTHKLIKDLIVPEE